MAPLPTCNVQRLPWLLLELIASWASLGGVSVCSVLACEPSFLAVPCVVRVVCGEVEGQLASCGIHCMLPAGERLPSAAVWLAHKPHPDIMQLVWDMVCLAAVHAMERGRRAAWAVAAGGLPALFGSQRPRVAPQAACRCQVVRR